MPGGGNEGACGKLYCGRGVLVVMAPKPPLKCQSATVELCFCM